MTTKNSVTRRSILLSVPSIILSLSIPLLRSNAALEYPELHGLDEKPDGRPEFRSINGIQIQDVSEGNNESLSVEQGTQVSLKYVLRRSNGYFIDASYGFDRFETFSFRPGSGRVIQGFDVGVEGMREGGRRRFIVPPTLGYVKGTGKQDPGPIPPDFGARRSLSTHAKESLIFEVAVVKVRSVSASSTSN